MDAVVVNQNALHFEVGLFAGGLVFEFYKGVLERVAGAFVSNYFAGEDFAETGED